VFAPKRADLGWFVEEIAPGAFKDCIAEGQDVRCLFNHDSNLILARSKSGTLQLAEDDFGLKIKADLADTQTARDLAVSMERGDVDQMSFAFTVSSETWSDLESAKPTRTIDKVETLYDVSPVTFPAYTDTSVQLNTDVARRSFDAAKAQGTPAPKPPTQTAPEPSPTAAEPGQPAEETPALERCKAKLADACERLRARARDRVSKQTVDLANAPSNDL